MVWANIQFHIPFKAFDQHARVKLILVGAKKEFKIIFVLKKHSLLDRFDSNHIHVFTTFDF